MPMRTWEGKQGGQAGNKRCVSKLINTVGNRTSAVLGAWGDRHTPQRHPTRLAEAFVYQLPPS